LKYITSEFNGETERLKVMFIGDLHKGSIAFKPEVLDRALAKVDADPDNYRIILMGDLMECATKTSVGAGIFEQNLTPDQQIDWVVDKFRPYRHLIDGAVKGNHEERAYKSVGIDMTKRVCSELDIPYLGCTGMIRYHVGALRYNVNVWHGSGGAGTAGNALNKCIKMANKVVADVYAMAHTHKLATTSRTFALPKTTSIEELDQHFVLTGSALSYDDSYPDFMNLERVSLGFPVVKLSAGTKKQIQVVCHSF
jgi:hypothetical protein